MKKFIKNIALIASAALAMVACTPEPAEVIDSITLNRCLTPTNLEAEIIASVGTDVELTWDVMKGTEFYTVEVFESTETTTDEEGNEVAAAPNFDAVEPFKTETNITAVPHVVTGLEVDKSYFVRVKGHATNVEDSNWAVLEEAFATSAVRTSFKLSVVERTESSVTIAWNEGEDATDLTTIKATPVSESSKKSVELALSDEIIAARTVKVEGLEPCVDYKFTLIYGKACNRGSITAYTRPSTEGATEVASIEALNAAITGATGDLKVKLAYNDGIAYDLASVVVPAGSLYIYGESTTEGKKPIVTGLDIQPAAAIGTIHIEDVILDGAVYAVEGAETKGNIITPKDAIDVVEFVNCEIFGYTKGFIYVGTSVAFTNSSFLVDGCYVHDVNADGTVGGDFIDFRAGTIPSIVIKNSTFYACARTFLRISDNADSDLIEVKNNTFNFVTTTKTSSNNAGIFGVRTKTTPATILCTKNVFLNEYSDGEAPGSEFVRLVRNSTDSNAPVCSGNYYFNVGAGWFVSAATTVDGAAFDEAAALADGGVLLEVDPCQSSGAGKLYLNETSDIALKQAGDPRWWNAAIPEPPVRATELEVVSEPYTWDFTTKAIYDGEVLNATTIIGNARIYASAEAPTEVKLGEGVYFAEAGIVDAEGAPMYGAIGVLTEGYGAVVVTATGDNGVEGVQVMAGGDRYTVLADGEPHKVLFGDLVGQNDIYVMGAGGVTLKSIEWTQDLTPDATAEPLKTPMVSFNANRVEMGTAQEMTATWMAVENANTYEVTWKGETTVLDKSATSFIVPAEEVAALGIGEYTLSIVAKPVETSSKWVASEVATTSFEIIAPPTGGVVTWQWNFSSIFSDKATLVTADATGEFMLNNDGSVTAAANTTLTQTLYLSGNGKKIEIKKFSNTADNCDYLAMTYGGGAAYAYINVDKPGRLTITASQGKTAADNATCELAIYKNTPKENQVGENMVLQPYDTAAPKNGAQTYEFEITDITELTKLIIYKPTGSTSPLIYDIQYTYEEATKAEYIWNFSDEIWETEVFSWLAPLGSDGSTDMDVTVDGLRVVAGGKNVRGYLNEEVGNYLQPNGGGSTTIRCFSFTAPGDGTVKVKVSNTGGSEDLARLVCVQVGDDASTLQEIAGGFPSSTPDFIEFDITASNQTVYIYPNKGLRFYQIEYHQN